ncbi:MAG TPA: exopolysaccharide biosynthesis polyprenyl glycosylphosphotransferase [Thermoanaerobaculia bacterium]|nr:exopolysaccharide biosynthesis polyprenyl glycosylphosphotransferase [Thermoanaerobaculia bacterium]
MIQAWALKTTAERSPLLAAGLVPPIAILILVLSTRGEASNTVLKAAGLCLLLLACEACFRWMGLYRFLLRRDFLRFLGRTAAAVGGALGLVWMAYLIFPDLSPGYSSVIVVGSCSVALMAGARSLAPALLRLRRDERLLIVGREELVTALCRDVLDHIGAHEEPRRDSSATTVDPVLLKEIILRERISQIIVAEPGLESRQEIASALLECRLMGVEVVDAVDLYQRVHGKIWLDALAPGRLVFSEGFRLTPSYLLWKRVVDVTFALALLALAAPILLLVALAIRLESPGPVLFRQERVGQHGRAFTLYKFRSMVEDAESRGAAWAQRNDARVTRIGKHLRRFHVDELPQAWNVLRGDLSFVGPRPERPCFVELLREQIPFYELRHYVKPGITGWAQVCYPYAASVEDSYEKLQYELYYAKHVSLKLDLAILARTAAHVLFGRGR